MKKKKTTKNDDVPILIVIPKQNWSKPIKKQDDRMLDKYWIAHKGVKTDWKIEKRYDTYKPYVLAKVCTGQRYGVFKYFSSAKLAAFLFDFG